MWRIRLTALLLVAGLIGPLLTSTPAEAGSGPLRWVALGDSFAAGVGLGPVEGTCDQDSYAYPPRATRDILRRTRTTDLRFLACSGYATLDVWDRQLPSVTSGHNAASVTVGGNDINFSGRVKGCYIGSCGSDTMSLSAAPITWDSLYSRLVTTYVNIRRRMSSTGHLYVVTYPIPFARESSSSCQGLSATEQNAANALVTRLGDTIYQAVQRANTLLPASHGRPGNVHFVDWRRGTRESQGYTVPSGYSGAGSHFDTYRSPYGLCNTSGNTPYLNGFVSQAWANPSRNNSFHPNSTGYWRAATIVADAINRYQ